jgi:hypothetical protein
MAPYPYYAAYSARHIDPSFPFFIFPFFPLKKEKLGPMWRAYSARHVDSSFPLFKIARVLYAAQCVRHQKV